MSNHDFAELRGVGEQQLTLSQNKVLCHGFEVAYKVNLYALAS